MGKFGERLRREREMRGISLEEIAEATKIGTRSLRALEEERFEQLPGGIFNKGFVRAYARFLGIDEEQAVSDYLGVMQEQQQSAEPPLEEIARQVQSQRSQMNQGQNSILTWLAVILIAGVVGIGVLGWHSWQKDKAAREAAARQELEQKRAASLQQQPALPVQQTTEQQPSNNTVEPAVQNPAVNGTGTASAPATQTTPTPLPEQQKQTSAVPTGDAAASSAPVNVTLSATARTWISVTIDGGKATTMTLDPNDPKLQTRTYHGSEKILLVVGNPAGLEATLNGKPVGSLGPEGQRRQITFTPEGKQ